MKKSIIVLVKCSISVLMLLMFTMVSGALITPLFGIELSNFEMPNQSETLLGLFTVGVIQVIVLTLVAVRTNLGRKSLGMLLSLIYFSINHVLNTMESLVFMRNIYPVIMQMVNLLNGLIISMVIGYTVAFLWVLKEPEVKTISKFLWSKKLIIPWVGWIFIWFVIYFCAGALIPMNVSGVKDYYFTGDGSAMDISLVPIGYILQIPRASIWILLAIALQKYQKGSAWEKSLITGIVFGCLMSSSLLVPNFLMPGFVRMAHLPEIMYANLLWGVIISHKVSVHISKE